MTFREFINLEAATPQNQNPQQPQQKSNQSPFSVPTQAVGRGQKSNFNPTDYAKKVDQSGFWPKTPLDKDVPKKPGIFSQNNKDLQKQPGILGKKF